MSLFELHALRFSFVAREAIRFEAPASNVLRGAFGTIFRRIACAPDCPGAGCCERRAQCPYARMFEPGASGGGASGLTNWPRPFVFRAMHLDGQSFAEGEGFHFDLHLFDTKISAVRRLAMAFAELGREGLGRGRRRVELRGVSRLNRMGEEAGSLYEAGTVAAEDVAPVVVDLDGAAGGGRVGRLRVRFVTPTELKHEGQVAARPEFGILAARARDRVSALREFYGAGPLEIDYRGFGQRAALVEMTRCEIEHVELRRRSSRTGQTHPIGGFVGEAEYEGELSEFAGYLEAAKWTGVGRQTVWGKGMIVTEMEA
ncbi:MAG: CRISPR system precrRNA processing endoribonuclease RAMP protein Cas6 [Acidobacteriaceae bacterium]|nr:CRISPR system precrRNA processing endoribonuclease RAMP protein Cas6 [Acidobacteriaceae bacterium]